MAEQFPRQFGKYVLLKSLARGGMGEIYLAASGQPGGLSKLCVIKKVITEKTDRAKVNRFLDEAKVVLRLSHANLVSTFDAGDVKGELFIAMELVEGKDLREIWNRCVRTRTRIPVDVALVVVREIARALAYVHTYGALRLVHRDVAPPNILLSYFGEVKLTDFGLARSTLKQEHTAPGVVFGRASYLAPEQARGEVADARTDVYALGIVLWELLTGQPYLQLAGLDPVTSLSLVRNPKTQPPSARAPWIPPDLDAIVLKALSADRATRFQSAEEMRRALAEVMTRIAPRADSERLAEFLRGLYRDMLAEESAERERLLAETLPLFRGETLPDNETPSTDVIEPTLIGEPPTRPETVAGGATAEAEAEGDKGGGGAEGDAAAAPATEVSAVSADGDVPPPVHQEATVVAHIPRSEPTDGASTVVSEAPKESLHVSALRARAGSHVRRPAADSSGADAPTNVWRKGPRRDDGIAAQTFVGRVIDNRYRIGRRIGEGGMGTVYAAEHVEIGKNVAVKILHRLFSGEEQLVERFRREARAASRVGDPHIVDVTDFGTTEEGCAYFVMELLEGMDLADVLVHEGRLVAARAVRIAVQICQALEAAHTAGIIHRDLKPENVFLIARNGQADFVKVLDFGIARNVSAGEAPRLTNPGMAMGTPEYMAPEQALGRPADRRTDVYSVGALLFEMVTGAAPFKSDSQQEMLAAKRRPPEALRHRRADIPLALDAVIMRTLDPDAERRPQTMAQLEYELTKIVGGRPQAVADLLGLRGPRAAGSEALPGMREEEPGIDVVEAADDSLERDLAGPTPPPAGAGPPAPDFEKMLEADLSPAPVMTSGGSGPHSGPRSGAHVDAFGDGGRARQGTTPYGADLAHPAAHPGSASVAVPVSVAAAPSGGTRRRLPQAVRPWAPPGVGVQLGAAVADPNLDLVRRPPSRTALVFLLLVGAAGGATAWAMNRGLPAPLQPIARRLGWGGPAVPAAAAGAPATGSTPGSQGRAGDSPANRPTAGGSAAGTAIAPRAPTGQGPFPPRSVPEIVQAPVVDRARAAMAADAPDDAVAVLRPAVARGNAAAKAVLTEALVASGWKDVKSYRWTSANRKAREALALVEAGAPSRGAHALLGETQYALGDFPGALAEFSKALAESPRDPRLKRRVTRSRKQMRPPTSAAGAPAVSAAPAAVPGAAPGQSAAGGSTAPEPAAEE